MQARSSPGWRCWRAVTAIRTFAIFVRNDSSAALVVAHHFAGRDALHHYLVAAQTQGGTLSGVGDFDGVIRVYDAATCSLLAQLSARGHPTRAALAHPAPRQSRRQARLAGGVHQPDFNIAKRRARPVRLARRFDKGRHGFQGNGSSAASVSADRKTHAFARSGTLRGEDPGATAATEGITGACAC